MEQRGTSVTDDRRGEPSLLPADQPVRPEVRGKFLYRGGAKIYVKGVTYGTFSQDENGSDSEYDQDKVRLDFAAMAANGITSVRTYTVPPRWLLDEALRNGLSVMVGLPWEQHIAFLDDPARVRSIRERVRQSVASCAGHPAVLCFAIGNEIPAPIVRWHGASAIENFLRELYSISKRADPQSLVTYVNFPSTEYLQLDFLDFYCFNVYLEDQPKLERYIARLHNLAGDVPVILAEIGLDSQRNGLEKQAHTLAWQVSTTFGSGCAGVFIFSWTDEWSRGGHEIMDWDFGLTTRDRTPKPALKTVSEAFRRSPFMQNAEYPKMSVVVCTYNGASVIRDCMEGLLEQNYPNFEVIVVDDGSTDGTGSIVSEFPFRLIRTENRGLGNARNTGLELATGDVVAYTDDDARPDTDWLYYLAQTYMTTDFKGVGGPNIAPEGDGWVAECVANAPGGPVHVLIDDVVAEHIPGCNCSFRTEALREIGGWDPRFRAAGDDVDVCWRIQHMGWEIGFNPAATVWHHRRNSIKMYWKQQIGYGKAESLLEEKWADKYNAAGHLEWCGRLYGKGVTKAIVSFYGRIYHGRWGTAPFQSLYERTPSQIWRLPLMPEWYLVVGLFLMLSIFGLFWSPLFIISATFSSLTISLLVVQAVMSAQAASFPGPPKRGWDLFRAYAVTTFLHMLQPLARLTGRLRHGLTPWRSSSGSQTAYPIPQERTIWSERWRAAESMLNSIDALLKDDGAVVNYGGDFDRWDLQVRGGLLSSARIRMVVEEHGAGKQLFKFKIAPAVSVKAAMLLTFLVTLTIMAGLQFFLSGGTVLIAGLGLALASAWLASFMYKECSSPFGSVLAALESAKKLLAEEAGAAGDSSEPAVNKRVEVVEEAASKAIGCAFTVSLREPPPHHR